MVKAKKQLYYLQAVCNGVAFPLERELRNILRNIPRVLDSQIDLFGELTQIMHKNLQPTNEDNQIIFGLLLHIACGVRNEHRRTITNNTNQNEDDGGSVPPPQGQSFLKQESFLYIFQHHVILCVNGESRGYNWVAAYLNALISQINNNGQSLGIEFVAVANRNILEEIARSGVRYIDFETCYSQLQGAILEPIERQAQIRQSHYVIRAINSIFNRFRRFTPLEPTNSRNIQDDIKIKFSLQAKDKRFIGMDYQNLLNEISTSTVNDIRNDAIETDINVKIELLSGAKYSSEQLRLSKSVQINKYEETNGLSHLSAFTELTNYFLELVDSGIVAT